MQAKANERKTVLTALCMLGALLVSGCAYLRSPDTSVDNTPIPHTAPTTDTKREACARACSNERDICDAGPASRNQVFDAPQTAVGAAAGCDKSLRDCLRYCK